MIIINIFFFLVALFFLCAGIYFMIKSKGQCIWLFLTLMLFVLFAIGSMETDNYKTYEEPAMVAVRDGTLVVIDSNNSVSVINGYKNGRVCIEKNTHIRVASFLNETFYTVNTQCQNLIK